VVLIAPADEVGPAGTGFDHVAEQKLKLCLVWSVDYKLTDELTLTAGIRYTDRKRT